MMNIENIIIDKGWQCPICKRVYNPRQEMCLYCGHNSVEKTDKVIINPCPSYVDKYTTTPLNPFQNGPDSYTTSVCTPAERAITSTTILDAGAYDEATMRTEFKH